jgi:hypothetical protein
VEDIGTCFLFTPDDGAGLARILEQITARHEEDSLNAFDPSPVLAERGPQRFIEQVLAVYTGGSS